MGSRRLLLRSVVAGLLLMAGLAVAAVQKAYQVRYAEALATVTVTVSSVERWFDWESGAFEPEPRVMEQGVVNLDTGQRR